VIFAVTNGYLDQVAVPEIKEWERGFLEYMGAEHPQIGEAIKKEKVISKELEATMRKAIESFNNLRGVGEKTA